MADDEAPQDARHQDDGLDLARSIARATAGSTPAARRRVIVPAG